MAAQPVLWAPFFPPPQPLRLGLCPTPSRSAWDGSCQRWPAVAVAPGVWQLCACGVLSPIPDVQAQEVPRPSSCDLSVASDQALHPAPRRLGAPNPEVFSTNLRTRESCWSGPCTPSDARATQDLQQKRRHTGDLTPHRPREGSNQSSATCATVSAAGGTYDALATLVRLG